MLSAKNAAFLARHIKVAFSISLVSSMKLRIAALSLLRNLMTTILQCSDTRVLSSHAAAGKVALLIGNSEYERYGMPVNARDIPLAENDLMAMAEQLRRMQFEVIGSKVIFSFKAPQQCTPAQTGLLPSLSLILTTLQVVCCQILVSSSCKYTNECLST